MAVLKVKIKKKDVFGLKDIAEIVLAVFAAWIFYQILIFATGTPMPIVSVVSNSMEPFIHRGDLLFVTSGNYQVGDIIIYQRDDVDFTIVHRIIEEKDSGFIIKGDNNAFPDPGTVQKSQIIGEVRFAFPLLGYPRLGLYAIGI